MKTFKDFISENQKTTYVTMDWKKLQSKDKKHTTYFVDDKYYRLKFFANKDYARITKYQMGDYVEIFYKETSSLEEAKDICMKWKIENKYI